MAPKRTNINDPYAPPPRYRDRSGRLVRVGLLALLIAGLGIGYFAWSASSPQTATLAPPAEQQQLADAGYRAQPEQIPQAQPVAPTPQQTAPSPERRRTTTSRAQRSAPADSTPSPVIDAPTTAAPVSPAPSTPQMPDATPPTQG